MYVLVQKYSFLLYFCLYNFYPAKVAWTLHVYKLNLLQFKLETLKMRKQLSIEIILKSSETLLIPFYFIQ